MINSLFGWAIVTPWDIGDIPKEDLDEILYKLDVIDRLGVEVADGE